MKFAVVVGVLLVSGLVHAQSITPGVWKAETSLKLNGIPLPGSENEECIPKSKAKDLKTTIAKDLKEKGCELTKWSVKKQKLTASLKCKSDDIDASGNLAGDVTKESYDLTGEAEGKFKGIPTSVTVKLTGNWVKACDKTAL